MLRELYTDRVDIEPDLELEDPLAVRAAMIRLQQLEADADRVKATKEAVVDAYDRQLASIDEQRTLFRRSLQAYVEVNGSAKFPDVGTAYLAKGEPKIEVVDKTELKAELGTMFVRDSFDETAAKQYALERAIEDGEIVPGTRLVPGGPRLQIRKA